MGKRYFKGPHEPGSSDLEYIEFTDGWPTRQVDIVDGQYYSSLDEPVPGIGGGLADQSLYSLALPDEWEISAPEFEGVWQQALAGAWANVRLHG
jgi:hypothetical protein